MEAWKYERSKKQDFFIWTVVSCSESTETLGKLESHDSWIALLNAAKIRNYQVIPDLEPKLAKSEIPNILYHHRC